MPIDEQWQLTFDAIEDAVWVLDRDFRIVRSNAAANRLFGRDAADMIGRPCWEVVHGSSGPLPDCPVLRMESSLRRETLDLPRNDRWLRVTAHPIFGPDGALAGAVHIAADITERRRSAQSQRRSEDRFRTVFEAANVGKSLTLPTGEVHVNQAFADMLGYERRDLQNRFWQAITHPDDLALSEEQSALLLSGEREATRFVKRYVHRDGSPVWADVSTVVHRDDAGVPLYFITTMVDITAQKLAEERQQRSEKLFAKAFHASPAGMTITRIADGTFTDVNDAFLEMVERTRDEVIGRTSTELGMWTADERSRTIREQIDADGLSNCELRVRARSGRLVDLLFSSRPIDVDGEPHHLTTMIDITARKRAELEMTASERKYRALFEQMNGGFVLFEAVQDEAGAPVNLRILAANHEFENTTGLVAAEVQGRLLTDVLPGIEDDEADWIGTYGAVALGGAPRRFERASELLGYHYSINAYQVAPGQCAVTFIDISELREVIAQRDSLAEQLLQSQKLESIGRLAGGVAHDFNNMLVVILGYGQSAMEDLHEGDPLRHDLEEIIKAARRSADLTRQLLAFSRKQPLQPVALNLNDVVAGLEPMLNRLVGETIALELQLAPDLRPVLVDPGQLENAVMNLVINARDVMPDGGALLVATANATLDEEYASRHAGVDAGRYVRLSITDDGAGMTPDVASKVFEPFFTTKAGGQGTGLGLASVYGFVKQSGGEILVYSEPGRGTTFKIYLPVTESTVRAEPAPATEPAADKPGGTVLVVEDEDSLRAYFGTIVSRLGYRVKVAANGGEAILLVEEKGFAPDVVLTDVILPEMSGPEIVARLRRTRPAIEAIYMSGYTDNAIAHHGVLDPGIPFIQKPFTVHDLERKLREVLGGQD